MRPTWNVIGLMSGTSTDGIDAVFVRLRENESGYVVRASRRETSPYAPALRRRLLHVAEGSRTTAEEIARLNADLGIAFAAVVDKVRKTIGTRVRVDLIGSHGHTVFHAPPGRNRGTPTTLQIGEPAIIAARTRITTVADFRPADVAAGGQGAPLVPYVHALLFRDRKRNRAIHNLGGISNVTYVPADSRKGEVIAFDTGPANMVIDAVTEAVTAGRQHVDLDGRLAARGRVDGGLLNGLLGHPFLRRPWPKSTGREEFGQTFVARFLARARDKRLRAADIVATATAFTAQSVAQAYRDFLLPLGGVDEVYFCGGGSRNPTLMAMLRAELGFAQVGVTDDLGVRADALEAIAFAILAVEAMRGRPANLPSVTGADRPMVLGKIVPGAPDGFRRLRAKIR
jgi:anhydro-N-acetylmuramic acid kinase